MGERALDDVIVVEVLENGDFPQGGGGNAFIVGVDSDHLDCYQLVAFAVPSLVYATVGSFS